MHICRNANRKTIVSGEKCGASIRSDDRFAWYPTSRVDFQGEFYVLMLSHSLIICESTVYYYR